MFNKKTGFYDNGKTTGKRGVARRCPIQFFSLDEEDPTAPCYSISTEPNVRRNWQVSRRNTILKCTHYFFDASILYIILGRKRQLQGNTG